MPLDLATVVSLTRAKRAGSGYLGHCPAHDDRTPSLSVGVGDSGKILFKCHAGCDTTAIMSALTMSDRLASFTRGRGSSAPAVASPAAYLGKEVAVYDYTAEDGTLLFQVVRFEPKDFRQRHPNGAGGWDWNMNGVRRVPFRLPELRAGIAAGRGVVIVEGEKDANRLHREGMIATTFAMGADAKLPNGWPECFRGSSVAVIPDNDDKGRQHAERLARGLQGIAASVKVVPLSGVPVKGDVSDWLNAAGSREALNDLIAATPEYSSSPNGAGARRAKNADAPSGPAPDADASRENGARPEPDYSRIVSVCLADVQAERVSWLWRGLVPFGKLTVIEGDPGCGKSTLTMHLAACTSAGLALPDGTQHDPADVLIVNYEDGAGDTLKPRALAAGADVNRVHILQGAAGELFAIPGHVAELLAKIEETKARLVVIDPLGAALSAETDSYKDSDVRRALAPLALIAETTGAAIVIVRHLRKAGGARAILSGGGSIGVAGAARSVLAVAAAPDNPDERVLASVKSNLDRSPPSLRFRIVSHELDSGPTSRIEWLGTSNLSADELLAARDVPGEDRGAIEEAGDWLTAALRDGPRPARELFREAGKEHIAERTLQRARVKIGATKRRDGFGKNSAVLWSLPDEPDSPYPPTPPIGASPHSVENLAPMGNVGAYGEKEIADGSGTNRAALVGTGRYEYVPGSPEEIAFLELRAAKGIM